MVFALLSFKALKYFSLNFSLSLVLYVYLGSYSHFLCLLFSIAFSFSFFNASCLLDMQLILSLLLIALCVRLIIY